MESPLKETVSTHDSELLNFGSLLRHMGPDLLAARELAWRLFVRNISAQYRQSLFGYAWAFVPPVFTSLIWIFLQSQRVFGMERFGGLAGLHRAPFEALVAVKGVGQAKAAQIKAAIELGRRLQQSKPEDQVTISSPAQAADLVKYDMQALDQEVLRVILMDTRNQVLDVHEVYRGSVNTAQVRAADVFKAAVRKNATALIVVHNHPSGDPTPSPDDVAVTRELIKAGEMIDVKVLDHIIIGRGRHVSMKERGLGFS